MHTNRSEPLKALVSKQKQMAISKKVLGRLLNRHGRAWHKMPEAQKAPLIRAEALVVMARMGVM